MSKFLLDWYIDQEKNRYKGMQFKSSHHNQCGQAICSTFKVSCSGAQAKCHHHTWKDAWRHIQEARGISGASFCKVTKTILMSEDMKNGIKKYVNELEELFGDSSMAEGECSKDPGQNAIPDMDDPIDEEYMDLDAYGTNHSSFNVDSPPAELSSPTTASERTSSSGARKRKMPSHSRPTRLNTDSTVNAMTTSLDRVMEQFTISNTDNNLKSLYEMIHGFTQFSLSVRLKAMQYFANKKEEGKVFQDMV